MDGSDALLAVAEVSVGLAGFTGIVMALYNRSDSWSEFDAVRALVLLITGFGALILSLVPLGLHFSGLSETAIWRVGSGAMAGYMLVYLLPWRSYRGLDWSRVPNNTAMVRFAWGGALANVGLQLANLWFGRLSLFFFGLLWYLAYGCVQFAVILYLRPRE